MESRLVGFALGGNSPWSRQLIEGAMKELAGLLEQPRQSTLHTTAPLGPGSGLYLNAAMAGIDPIGRSPQEWLGILQAIEFGSGRNREDEIPWGDRVLDADLLFVGDMVVVTQGLILPHPQMHRRSFVMAPLLELGIEWTHPVLERPLAQLSV